MKFELMSIREFVRSRWKILPVLAMIGLLGGCAVAQTIPKSRPFGEVDREERGEVMSVRDTRIDLRTGSGRAVRAQTPRIPLGPIAVAVPLQIGGEKPVEVPAEEITVRLSNGRLIMVVQELSNPPFAAGEKVRVLHGRRSDQGGEPRARIERD